MLRQALRLRVEPLRRVWRSLSERESGIHPIAHHGLQRSGTNYLCTLLAQADYRVVNRIDPDRTDPRHKHFRWQADKSTIVMDRRYGNALQPASLAEVNALCGYARDMRHVVLFRHPRSWLDAIFRWGLQNGWFASEAEFLSRGLYRAYLAEWHAYYGTWADFAQGDPARVLILGYADLKRDPGAVLARIDAFAGVIRRHPPVGLGQITKVRHSRPMAEPRESLHHPDLDAAALHPGRFDWRAISDVPE